MSCNKLLNAKGDSIVVYGTSTRYTWTTGWMLVHGMGEVDVLLNVRDVTGNWQGKPCYQTATALPELPDSPTVFSGGSYVSSAGFTHFRETLSITDKYWIRFGVAASNTSGVNLGSAQVDMQVSHSQCGSQVALVKAVIHPGMISGTDTNVFEAGDFTPTIGFSKVMAAIVVMNNLSDYLEDQLFVRTANDPRAPNDWVACEAGWSNPASGNSQRNTTALSAPGGASVTSYLLMQFGIGARQKSGAGGNPRAEMYVAIARSNA
ncbi:MAG: hypothetical protein H6738_18245 [Alphaproteobacteria bacterium]|nr:hypothetical protein [Alphaproteobacteria bacterium]